MRRGFVVEIVVLGGFLSACDRNAAMVSGGRTAPGAHANLGTSPHTGAPSTFMSSDSGAPPQAIVVAGGAPPSKSEAPSAPSSESEALSAPSSDTVAADSLVGEERERDPRSKTIKVKVVVDPRRQARVMWGSKDFGLAPLEIERPRNSGPLDLVVVAPGYLPFHARAFTDRDDVLVPHLYAPAEAPQLLGYRSSAVPAGAGAVPAGADTK